MYYKSVYIMKTLQFYEKQYKLVTFDIQYWENGGNPSIY